MHVSGIPVDLYSLLQFGFTAVLIGLGLLHLVKSTASKYFVVDASFDEGGDATAAAEGRRKSQEPMIAVAGGGDGCAVCGNSASKKCSGCKAVRYCTETCQSKHWKAGHKLKCKELKLLALDSRKNLFSHGGNTVVQLIKKVLFPYEEFVKLFNWEKAGFPPCGLLNCGNSCFANVVLQCLSCTRPLVAYLLEKDHRRECRRNDWCFLCELQNHVQRARQSLQPFSPLNILSRLPNIGGNLGYGKQEDAHEFMRFAIDTMQSVCLDEFGGEKSLHPSSQETTLIQYIFGGHLQSQVTCTKCKKISHRYENMMDLTVEIQGDAASLEDCLDQFTAQEWLDGENMYKCDGCNDYVKACKRLTIFRAPNVLTIALKRFQSGRFGKLNKRVTFPETLDLSQYMSEPSDGTDLYQLYAVVVHIDMLNASFFGHYICYTKDFGGNWYRIDDYKVATVELEEVLAQGAYMLLYRRTSVRPSHAKPLETSMKQQQQMELIKGNLPCLNSNYGQVNSISRDEIMPLGMTSPTEEFCSRKEDPVNMDIDDPIGVTHTSSREYQQDQDLSNPELISLGSKDFYIDSEHSNSSESVATSQIVQRGISNSNSSRKSSLSIQVYNMQPEASVNDYDVECSFEDGGRTGGNFDKESVCMEIMDDCLPIENDIHEMAEKPRSGGSVDGLIISHEAHGASFQRLPNPRLERPVIVESGEEVPTALDREVKISKLDAGNPCLRDKLKPLFTPGFLEKSTRCKSLNMNGKAQVGPHEVAQSREVASNCNGSTKPGSPHQGNRGVDDNHVSFDLDGRGRCRFTDKQLNKCSNGVDISFDNLHSEEVASPAEHACKVVYSSPPLNQSSSVEAHGLKHEAWGRRFDGDHCFENGNGVALHDLETPVSSLSQNGGHEMETLFSVPVTVSSAIDESSLTCLTHRPNPRLDHQVASFKSESNFPAAWTTEAKSSKLSEENSCSSGERITLFSPGFVDKQVGQTYQNGNGSQMEICEDGLIQSINDCNGDIKSDFLHQNSCEINDPDGIFLNHNGQLTSGFIDNQHENCMDEDGATNEVLDETGKKLIHCNGNSGSVSDEDKKIGNFQAAFRRNDKALFSPGFHDKSVKKKSHEKDVEGRDASEIVSSVHDRNKLPRIG